MTDGLGTDLSLSQRLDSWYQTSPVTGWWRRRAYSALPKRLERGKARIERRVGPLSEVQTERLREYVAKDLLETYRFMFGWTVWWAGWLSLTSLYELIVRIRADAALVFAAFALFPFVVILVIDR